MTLNRLAIAVIAMAAVAVAQTQILCSQLAQSQCVVSGTLTCKWCDGMCMQLSDSCCQSRWEQGPCTSYSEGGNACKWCPSATYQCTNATCPTMPKKFCYNAPTAEQCDMTLDLDGLPCAWCGWMGCVDNKQCRASRPVVNVTIVSKPSECEFGWTPLDLDITISSIKISNVTYQWLARPVDNETYMWAPAQYLNRTEPVVTLLSREVDEKNVRTVYHVRIPKSSLAAGDSWKSLVRAYDEELGIWSPAAETLLRSSTTCPPKTCEQITSFDTCRSVARVPPCYWCGSSAPVVCHGQSFQLCENDAPLRNFTNGVVEYRSEPLSTLCWTSGSVNGYNTRYASAWLVNTSGLQKRLLSVHSAFMVHTASTTNYPVNRSYTDINFVVYAVNATDGSPSTVVSTSPYRLWHPTPGLYELDVNLFASRIVFNGTFLVGWQWPSTCPGISMAVGRQTARAVGDAFWENTGVWAALAPSFRVPATTFTTCGNLILDAGEGCDGGDWCGSNCQCPPNFVTDGTGCKPNVVALSAPVVYEIPVSSFVGPVYNTTQNLAAKSDCLALCMATPLCTAYTWQDKAVHACHLYLNGRGNAAACDVCETSLVAQCPGLRIANAAAAKKGNEMSVVAIKATADACAEFCCEDGACIAWTHSPVGECTKIYSAGWIILNQTGYTAGIVDAKFNYTPRECLDGTEFCRNGRCIWGRSSINGTNCSCVRPASHTLDDEPYLSLSLSGAVLSLSVVLPQTNPPRENPQVVFNDVVRNMTGEPKACYQYAKDLFQFNVSDLIKLAPSKWCSVNLSSTEYRLTCLTEIRFSERVLLTQRKRQDEPDTWVLRNVTVALKFHLAAATQFNVSGRAFVMGSSPMWAVVSKSQVRVMATHLEVDVAFQTRAPEYSHIDVSTARLTRYGNVINVLNLTWDPTLAIRQVQNWALTMHIATSVCTLQPGDYVQMDFVLRHYNTTGAEPILYNSSLQIKVGQWETLCSVSTGTNEDIKYTARTALDATFLNQNAFFFPKNDVYVGLSLSLPWGDNAYGTLIAANVTRLYARGNAVNKTLYPSGEFEMNMGEFNYTPVVCPAIYNLTVCYKFNLLDGKFVEEQDLEVLATLQVSALNKTVVRRSLTAGGHSVPETLTAAARIYTGRTVRLAAAKAEEAAQPKPAVVVMYQTPVVALVGVFVGAIASGMGIAGFSYFVYQCRRPAASAV